VTYALLADGRDEKEMKELDLALAPSDQARDAIVERANMEAMQQLQGAIAGLAPPGRPR